MTWTLNEALQDAHEDERGYDQDVTCTECEDAAVVRFRNGEPIDENLMVCHCGGAMEVL